ncbi:SDR family NAD(P)-dependent oxidoreductase [Maricaulis sp. D1M11]|uniref:SDR family NAD(P)-dependent oxidoreductase n=1 Tax=Maricaulis sp. D1M11 TaxID=3076117 RepID=UPI0039B3E529
MRKFALITGASSGIGLSLAREFAAEGWDVGLVARRREKLEQIGHEIEDRYGVEAVVIVSDLSQPDAPHAIVEACEVAGRQIDALVNNAGAGMNGGFLERSWDEQYGFLELMLHNYLKLGHLVLPGMVDRKFGRIINVSSVSALLPISPAHTRFSGSLYPGIKSLLVRWSQSLRLEHEADNIHVTALCPGFTLSEFHDVNGARSMVSSLPSFWMQTADQVAKSGYEAVMNNIPVRVTGAWNKFMVGLNRVLPDPVSEALMRAQTKRMKRQLEKAPETA